MGDVEGAQVMTRVGRLPFSVYGPLGNRPAHPSNLTTADIPGAQASSLKRGPKVPPHSARSTGAAIVASSVATPRGPSPQQIAPRSGTPRVRVVDSNDVGGGPNSLAASDTAQATLRPAEAEQATLRLGADVACIPAE